MYVCVRMHAQAVCTISVKSKVIDTYVDRLANKREKRTPLIISGISRILDIIRDMHRSYVQRLIELGVVHVVDCMAATPIQTPGYAC